MSQIGFDPKEVSTWTGVVQVTTVATLNAMNAFGMELSGEQESAILTLILVIAAAINMFINEKKSIPVYKEGGEGTNNLESTK